MATNLMDTWGVDDASSYGVTASHLHEDLVQDLSQKEAALLAKEASPEQQPIFSVEHIDYRITHLKQMVVCSGFIIMATDNGQIHRLHLSRPSEVEVTEVSRTDPIHKIFLDPTGKFLLISLGGHHPEVLFWYQPWKKPKPLLRLKGIIVNSVAWDRSVPDNSPVTGELLLGTTVGTIYSTIIDAREGKERTFRQVYNMNDEIPVTGLRYDRFPHSHSHDPPRYFVMATTPSRLYQFVGGPQLDLVFDGYLTNPGFQELSSNLGYSELCFFQKYGVSALPEHFAWLTGVGLFHGKLSFGSQTVGDSVCTDTTLLPYPPPKQLPPGAVGRPPLSLRTTEFHFLLVFEDRFVAIGRLNEQVVCDFDLPKRLGKPKGLTQDPVEGTVWLYFENGIFEVIINNEDRNVWELFLEQGKFKEALNHCREPAHLDKVHTALADWYFSQRSFELAAKEYGETQKSFEEVALKFIQINERDALKTFLLSKLSSLSSEDKTQLTIICTWLVEIFLNKLNQLHDSGNDIAYEVLRDQFRQFLAKYHPHLNPATTFHLISSHGRIQEMLAYAMLIKDFGRVVSYFIEEKKYPQALDVMSRYVSEELFYKFSPVLMRKCPVRTVNALLAAGAALDPRKLIPALMRYNPRQHDPDLATNPPLQAVAGEHQAIRYLRQVVGSNRDPAVHNYLLSLYAEQKDEDNLIAFLNVPNPVFDLKYALRLATKFEKTKSCVLIYSSMGLYEEAVDLALKIDPELAKYYADKPEDDEGLRKRLWLKIARHVVEVGKDIKKAMAFLHQCELLKIEDILPFFPDFVLIDDFKQEICASLEEYNQHIDNLKKEMDEATQSADAIRRDIKNIRNKYGFVREEQKCDICGYHVLTRQFYLFPCQHVFHSDCLIKEVSSHLSIAQQIRLQDIRDQIANIGAHQQPQQQKSWLQALAMGSEEGPVGVPQLTSAEQLKAELDDICAAECLLCGDLMIKTIDQPFILENEREAIRSWLVD